MDTVRADDRQSGADLVSRIRAGDQRAEEELVERYRRSVAIVLRREVRHAVVAADLTQETFRIALEKIRHGDLREPEKLSGFICSLARNLAIGHHRQSSREESLTEIELTHGNDPDGMGHCIQQHKSKHKYVPGNPAATYSKSKTC